MCVGVWQLKGRSIKEDPQPCAHRHTHQVKGWLGLFCKVRARQAGMKGDTYLKTRHYFREVLTHRLACLFLIGCLFKTFVV